MLGCANPLEAPVACGRARTRRLGAQRMVNHQREWRALPRLLQPWTRPWPWEGPNRSLLRHAVPRRRHNVLGREHARVVLQPELGGAAAVLLASPRAYACHQAGWRQALRASTPGWPLERSSSQQLGGSLCALVPQERPRPLAVLAVHWELCSEECGARCCPRHVSCPVHLSTKLQMRHTAIVAEKGVCYITASQHRASIRG